MPFIDLNSANISESGVRELSGPGFAGAGTAPSAVQQLSKALQDSPASTPAAAPVAPTPVSTTPVNSAPPVSPAPVTQASAPAPQSAPAVQVNITPAAVTEPTGGGFGGTLDLSLPDLAKAPQPSAPVAATPAASPAPEPNRAQIEVFSTPLAPRPAVSVTQNASAPSSGPNIDQNTQDLQTKTYSVQDLLLQALKMGASDLHLSAGYRAMARVDGKLKPMQSQLLDPNLIRNMLDVVVKGNMRVDLNRDKDLDLSYELTQPRVRFRVNIFQQRGSLAAVFRVVPNLIKTPEELKLPPIVKEFTSLAQGLVLVTGPTGSGKTTTLASMINTINLTQPKHIITIEDPIEYIYPRAVALVDQRAAYIDTRSWATSLRAALRQDPDVVLIGEMRDVETMEAALQVAETGHLVFSTLHTNSASQTIDRIIDAFPEAKQSQVRTQLAGTLMAVVSQRLLPLASGGRRVAAEILVLNSAVRNAIRENKVYQIDNMIQTSAELGMITMEKSLVGLVREGLISVETAQTYANKPEDLLTLLGNKG